MNILGISAGFHDAAATVIGPAGDVLFAAHSERYSRLKNDCNISPGLLHDIENYHCDTVSFYERPWLHNAQQLMSGQAHFGAWTARAAIENQIGVNSQRRYVSFPHHLSHAAAGFQTSPFRTAAVVVIDAIGELDTISIYRAWYDQTGRAQYRRLWRRGYPHSIGLFYSAVTKAVGLKPMDEEYITMGMAAYGSNLGAAYLMHEIVSDPQSITFDKNLHIGLDQAAITQFDKEDLAASAQEVAEILIKNVMRRAREITGCTNLVYMGGVALNCLANRHLGDYFDDIWIMPNPGDAGSSLGAAALAYGKRVDWRDAFLGHRIPGDYPVRDALHHLHTNLVVGVASGRAEFGPRALGNRSLLADPRGSNIKDQVNAIKRRQKFRPFAPVILAEMVNDYFDMPRGWIRSDYMQVVARCRRPDLFPAICHVDGTSRVQTVAADSRSGIRQLLEAWYDQTGCPMLLNTSLNIRGEPMVNNRADADRFQRRYRIPVVS